MPEVINVYRIDYERGKGDDAQNWSAFIAGYSSEEALSYLGKWYGGKPVRINTIGLECRLDAITDELRAKITDIPKPKPGRPAGAKTKVKEDGAKYIKTEEKTEEKPEEKPKTKRSIIK